MKRVASISDLCVVVCVSLGGLKSSYEAYSLYIEGWYLQGYVQSMLYIGNYVEQSLAYVALILG